MSLTFQKLWNISNKFWFFFLFFCLIFIFSIYLFLTSKIEMYISIVLKTENHDQKILVESHLINYFYIKKNLTLKIDQKFYNIEITNIKFSHETNVYEINFDQKISLLPNSTFFGHIIFKEIKMIDFMLGK